MRVISRDVMLALDQYAINEFGIPSRVLMETAGKACFEEIVKHFRIVDGEENNSFFVFCGTGNNGGDGLVISRWLAQSGFSVEVFLAGSVDKMSEETAANLGLVEKLGIPIYKFNSLAEFKMCLNRKSALSRIKQALVVDAIFGIGLKGNVTGWKADLINFLNELPVTRVAIDIPSGLDADRGMGDHVINADLTIAVAAVKYGMLLNRGRDCCGKIRVIDIGIPWKLGGIEFSDNRLIESPILPQRKRTSNKADYGKIAVIAGSPGFTGAAVLACEAIQRAGGGLVTLFHHDDNYLSTIFEQKLTEVMTRPIRESGKNLSDELGKYDVLLAGPGLGVNSWTAGIIRDVSRFWEKPLVLDADALNIISLERDILDNLRDKKVLLTPHIGEFARILSIEKSYLMEETVRKLQEFVNNYRVSVLLKNYTSVYADPENLYFNITGNDGLSKGGSGDVLAGIITAFLGQRMSIPDAAISGAFVLGDTAEKVAEKREALSVTPQDIINHLFVF